MALLTRHMHVSTPMAFPCTSAQIRVKHENEANPGSQWSYEQVKEWLAKMRAALLDRKVHAYQEMYDPVMSPPRFQPDCYTGGSSLRGNHDFRISSFILFYRFGDGLWKMTWITANLVQLKGILQNLTLYHWGNFRIDTRVFGSFFHLLISQCNLS